MPKMVCRTPSKPLEHGTPLKDTFVRLMNGRPHLALDARIPDEVMTKIPDDYARPLVAPDS